MCTCFAHALVGMAIGRLAVRQCMPASFWLLSAFWAAAPDLDAIGHWLGVPYDSPFGHRGFTHSLLFAAIASALTVGLCFRDERFAPVRWRLAAVFFLATASHGVLDAFTNGGLGIAFFFPFSNHRFFFPWTPIEVSPLSISAFFSSWGVEVLLNEALWVLAPTAAVLLIVEGVRRIARPA